MNNVPRRACVIFDLDGTLCDHEHRLHYIRKEPKDWDAFHAACVDDTPNPPAFNLYRALCTGPQLGIVFCTGRPADFRPQTIKWLMSNRCGQYDYLLMRPSGDFRPDTVIKAEMLARLRGELIYDPVLAVDDRPDVLALWREAGLPVVEITNLGGSSRRDIKAYNEAREKAADE